jgi:aminocarboxymuconate-semialdehyde decarboxylase
MLIDAHAHLVPAYFPALPTDIPVRGWPSTAVLADGRLQMTIDGKLFRTIERGYFDLSARLEWMDQQGIDVQVISPLPELLGHWLDADTASEMARLTNVEIAAAVKAAPLRLAGLGMLPWQDVPRAAHMVGELVTLGLRGVEVGSNIDGRSVADPAHDPIFAALAQHRLALFVHGSRPPAPERLLGPSIMINVVGIPQDGASAVASFIATDVLARHPTLKLGFAHGGGTFAAVLDRMDFVWREMPALRETSACSPREYVRRFYFDNITYSVPFARYLLDAYGADVLMSGSDGPTKGAQQNLSAFALEVCGGNETAATKMQWRNAADYFGLKY